MSSPKAFNCVRSAREVRDKISAEIENMTHDELRDWLRSAEYTDPVLKLLAERAAQQADSAISATRRR